MAAEEKPAPVADPTTAPYWEAARGRRLVVQRCGGCRRYHHPPRLVCPDCRSEALRWEEVSGRGSIYSYTIARQSRTRGFGAEAPYVVVLVAIAEQADCRGRTPLGRGS